MNSLESHSLPIRLSDIRQAYRCVFSAHIRRPASPESVGWAYSRYLSNCTLPVSALRPKMRQIHAYLIHTLEYLIVELRRSNVERAAVIVAQQHAIRG